MVAVEQDLLLLVVGTVVQGAQQQQQLAVVAEGLGGATAQQAEAGVGAGMELLLLEVVVVVRMRQAALLVGLMLHATRHCRRHAQLQGCCWWWGHQVCWVWGGVWGLILLHVLVGEELRACTLGSTTPETSC